MAQNSETLYDNMPCPQCGSTRLIQHITQSEDVHVNESGDVERIEPRDSITVEELDCPECDETIWSKE